MYIHGLGLLDPCGQSFSPTEDDTTLGEWLPSYGTFFV